MSHFTPTRVADRHAFDTLIDARSPAEFALDHLPGAINLPVLNDGERAEVGGAKIRVVLSRDEDVAWLSLRNVASVHALAVDQLNAYDVLNADDVVFTTAALADFTGTAAESEEAAK